MQSSAGTAPRVVPVIPPRLTPREKLSLIGEILRTYGRARRALSSSGLRGALESLRGRPAPAVTDALDPQSYGEALRMASAVARVCGPLPVDSRCLIQSLVLTSLLARRGIGTSLVLGVRGGDEFGAHAWVEFAGRPLLPTGDGEFERLVAL